MRSQGRAGEALQDKPLRLFLVAGEHSGDALGGKLIEAMRALSPRPLELTGVGLQLVFRPNERGKRRVLSFYVGHPNSCSLHAGDPLHDVAEQLLRRWGIDVSARNQDRPATRRRSFQRGLDV